ncbi:hypothetical protein [Streptomyces antimycoticus]|uniref:hypothetical protein n=1 Tax=Streptomyces antimycoticus TaxID=68175 RepID=UPI0013751326|nr:hypothetical protein [Streptomyces antimycoticus]
MRFVEVVKEAGDAVGDPLVAFDLAISPAAWASAIRCLSTQKRSLSRGAYSGVVMNFAQLR